MNPFDQQLCAWSGAVFTVMFFAGLMAVLLKAIQPEQQGAVS